MREGGGLEGERPGQPTGQGKYMFFWVKLIGCCQWQKERLEMALPTLADSLIKTG